MLTMYALFMKRWSNGTISDSLQNARNSVRIAIFDDRYMVLTRTNEIGRWAVCFSIGHYFITIMSWAKVSFFNDSTIFERNRPVEV